MLSIELDGTSFGTNVILQPKYVPVNLGQLWIRHDIKPNGEFTLKNPTTGKILVASSDTTISARGKYSQSCALVLRRAYNF